MPSRVWQTLQRSRVRGEGDCSLCCSHVDVIADRSSAASGGAEPTVPADAGRRHIRGQLTGRARSEGLPVVGFHRETERTGFGDASPQDGPPVVDVDVDA